jgi:hypothetical protein
MGIPVYKTLIKRTKKFSIKTVKSLPMVPPMAWVASIKKGPCNQVFIDGKNMQTFGLWATCRTDMEKEA